MSTTKLNNKKGKHTMTSKEINAFLEGKFLNTTFGRDWKWEVLHAIRKYMKENIPDLDDYSLQFDDWYANNQIRITYHKYPVLIIKATKHKVDSGYSNLGGHYTVWKYNKIETTHVGSADDMEVCLNEAIDKKRNASESELAYYNKMKEQIHTVLEQTKLTKQELFALSSFIEKHRYSLDDTLFENI